MNNSQYFDELETRDPEQRERDLLARLPVQIRNAQQNALAFADILAGHDPAQVNSRSALAKLPVVRKSELLDLQKKNPPLGGLTTSPLSGVRRVFASPGPIYEPEADKEAAA